MPELSVTSMLDELYGAPPATPVAEQGSVASMLDDLYAPATPREPSLMAAATSPGVGMSRAVPAPVTPVTPKPEALPGKPILDLPQIHQTADQKLAYETVTTGMFAQEPRDLLADTGGKGGTNRYFTKGPDPVRVGSEARAEDAAKFFGVPVESVRKYRAMPPVDFWENIKSETPMEMGQKILFLGDYFKLQENRTIRRHADTLKEFGEKLDEIKGMAQHWLEDSKAPMAERREKYFALIERYRAGVEKVAATPSGKFMAEYLDKQAEAIIRGKTTAAEIGSAIAQLPKYMGEFVVTGGLYAAGKKVGLRMATRLGVKTRTMQAFVGAAMGTGARMSLLWADFVSEAGRRRLPKVRVDASGQYSVTESDKSAVGAYLGAFANQYLELLTEVSGEAITKGFRKFMPHTAATLDAWKVGKPASVIGWHGMPAEFGEEVFSKFSKSLATSLGIDTGEKDWLMNTREALITLGVLAVPTAATAVISRGKAMPEIGQVVDTPDGKMEVTEIDAEAGEARGFLTEPPIPAEIAEPAIIAETPPEAPVSEKPPVTPPEPEVVQEPPAEAAPAPVAEVEAPVEPTVEPEAVEPVKPTDAPAHEQTVDDFVERRNIEAMGQLDEAVDRTIKDVPESTFTSVRRRIFDILGVPGEGDVLFRIGRTRRRRSQVNLSDPKVLEDLARTVFKAQAESEGLDPEGILGPRSGLTDTGKKARVAASTKAAQKILDDVGDAISKMRAEKLAIADHKTAVEAALAANRPVPAEVLADYPDLKPAPAAPKPPAKPKKAKPLGKKKAKKPFVRSTAEATREQERVNKELRERNKKTPDHVAATIAVTEGADVREIGGEAERRRGDDANALIAKNLKQLLNTTPEFAIDPTFTVNADGWLVFHDGYTLKFAPDTFGLDTEGMKQGETIRIPLEDFGIDAAKYIKKAETFAKKGFQQRKLPKGRIERAAETGATLLSPLNIKERAKLEKLSREELEESAKLNLPVPGDVAKTSTVALIEGIVAAKASRRQQKRESEIERLEAAETKPEKIELPDYAKRAAERIKDRNKGRLTTGVDPADIKDAMIYAAGVVDMLVKKGVKVTKQAWSESMKALNLSAAALDDIWNRTKKRRDSMIARVKPEGPTRKQFAQGHIAAKKAGLLTDKGKATDAYRKLAEETTGKSSMADMTESEAATFIEAIDAIRPKKVGSKNVITEKTEKKIQSLKTILIARDELTEERFKEQLTELGLPAARYVDRKTFLTEREGKALIRKMNDEAIVIRPREEARKALSEDANAGVAMIVDSLDTEIDRRRKKRPGPAKASQYKGARYVALDLQEQTGLPFHDIWNAMNNARLNIKTKIANITKRIVASSPEAAGIMKDAEASQRVNDYIASKRAKDPAPYPNDITAEEIKVAKTIETMLKKFENHVRLARFMEHYYRKAEIPNAPEADLLEATDIYESEGLDAVSKYLDTRTWGIIKKGYEPHEAVTSKIVRGPRTIAFGKGHIKVRQDDGMDQDRTIFQRLDSYARQILNKVDLEPHVRALVRLHDENTGVFKDPASANKAIVLMVEEAKGFRDVPSSLQILVRRTVSQAFRATFLRPDLTIRNLHQNFAFNEDFLSGDLLDPRNKPLSQEDTDFFDNRVDMLAPIHQQYLMQEEKGIPGFGWLNKAAEKVQHYGLGDKWNRQWAFWGRINRLRRAFAGVDPGNRAAVKKAMDKGGFAGLELTQQRRAMEIMAQYGKDAMIRYAAGLHVLNVHFAYDRAQRSPVEMGSAGRTWGSLLAFPRSWAERMYRESRKVIHGGTHTSRYRALGRLIQMTIIPALVGELYKLWTGKDRNPYNPLNVLSWTPGGLVVGAVKVAGSVIYSTVQALQGDRDALGRIPSDLTRLANMYVPFYEIVTNILNASLDMEGVDRYAARKIREALDESYKTRDSSYEAKRDWVEKFQRVLGGKAAGKEPKKPKKTAVTGSRAPKKR